MEKILEIQKNVKAIVRKHQNNLIKLNVEVFRRSIDCYDNYAISSFGRVKNTKTGKVLKARDNGHGYLLVCLCEDGVKKTHLLHRLVACAFLENPNDKEFVDHIDNNPQNNHISNLRLQPIKKINRIVNLVLEIHQL